MTRAALVQRALLSLCAFGMLQLVASVVYAHVIDGSAGIADTTGIRPFVYRIEAIEPNSPAARAGLRAGDVVDVHAMSADDRAAWYTVLKYGERYRLPVTRNGHRLDVVVDVDRNIADDRTWQMVRWQYYVRFAGILAALAIAAFILAKRPGNTDVSLLASIIAAIALGADFGPNGAWALRSGALMFAGFAAAPFMFFAARVLFVIYAIRFARPPSRLRWWLTIATIIVAGASACSHTYNFIAYYTGISDDSFGFAGSAWYPVLVDTLPNLLPILCALLAIRDARGIARSRVAWATSSLALLLALRIASSLISIVDVSGTVSALVYNLSFPIAALGLGYALLGHRLLDVGFALNRAAIFTAVSLVVVGLFSLGEWALGGWLQTASKSTNIVVSAGLALALGLSIHPIHAWVDRIVDTVLFAKRHGAELAIRTFAKEVAYVTDVDVMIARAQALLLAKTDCTFVDVALYDGATNYGAVDENDAALVTMRATHEPVRLRPLETAFTGEFAFPMSGRGRVIGALVIGPKRLGESYAPDERDAIADLARAMGVAIDVLTLGRERHVDTLLESNRAIVEALDRLPDAIAAKLGGVAGSAMGEG